MLVLKHSSIEARGVSLSYGARRVLHDVDLRIASGEFFCLLGPSGAGKTSFLRVVAGLESPDAGELLIDGESVTARPLQTRGVGMVAQGLGLWPYMTVGENIAYGLRRRKLPAAQIGERVDFMLALVGLADCAGKYPGELSGGQQQKVALARALAVEPRILLLDQPMSAVDQAFRTQLLGEIRALQRKLGITTIMVTHEPEEALAVADRIAVIRDGQVQQVGSPSALYDYPLDAFVAASVGTANLIAGHVAEDVGGIAFHSPATGAVRLYDGGDRLRLPRPGGACACFRPTSVRIAPYDAEVGDDDCVWMRGSVRRSEFRGGFLRYSVDVEGGSVVCDQAHRKAALPMAPGSEVLLGVEVSQIRIINV